MKKVVFFLITAFCFHPDGFSARNTPTRQSVLEIADRAFEFQQANPTGTELWEWHYGTYYSGLLDLYKVDPQVKYLKAMTDMGNSYSWSLRPRPYDANVFAVAHMYLGLYPVLGFPEMIANTGYNLDANFERDPARPDVTMTGNRYWHNWWSWCDALFMAPPAYALYSRISGDPKYLDKMDKLWAITHSYLYDQEDNLYYRDDKYIKSRTPKGKKTFWSRGNGWVMGGLVKVLQAMPADYENRAFYEGLFVDMARKVRSLQLSEGYWPVSLLDPSQCAGPESSGTSFFCYALCYGINAGYLPREEFEPVVMKAWGFLSENVNEHGRLGYVQLVGESPGNVLESHTESYGQGALMMAASEMCKLLEK